MMVINSCFARVKWCCIKTSFSECFDYDCFKEYSQSTMFILIFVLVICNIWTSSMCINLKRNNSYIIIEYRHLFTVGIFLQTQETTWNISRSFFDHWKLVFITFLFEAIQKWQIFHFDYLTKNCYVPSKIYLIFV